MRGMGIPSKEDIISILERPIAADFVVRHYLKNENR
jgi:hypothetical protein